MTQTLHIKASTHHALRMIAGARRAKLNPMVDEILLAYAHEHWAEVQQAGIEAGEPGGSSRSRIASESGAVAGNTQAAGGESHE